MKRRLLDLMLLVVLVGGFALYRSETHVIAQTSTPGESEVSVANGSGYGSTGVYARTFSTVVTNIGDAITYSSDATNGDSFTINSNGVYSISYNDGNPNVDNVGISLNLSPTSAWSTSWSSGNELCNFVIANSGAACSTTVLLATNDVIRAHRNVTTYGANSSQTEARFIIIKVR